MDAALKLSVEGVGELLVDQRLTCALDHILSNLDLRDGLRYRRLREVDCLMRYAPAGAPQISSARLVPNIT